VAEVLAGEPDRVAFDTVTGLALRAGTSGPSVVRFAIKLGYRGFVDLQASVQEELAPQLRSHPDRLLEPTPDDTIARAQSLDVDNVVQTPSSIDAECFEDVVTELSDPGRQVVVLSGETMLAVGQVLADHLAQLREGVTLVAGSAIAASTRTATLAVGDVVVALDVQRYERWLPALMDVAPRNQASIVAITDHPLSPLAALANERFSIAGRGVGPFDSLVGALSLTNAIVAALALRLGPAATARLDAIEAIRPPPETTLRRVDDAIVCSSHRSRVGRRNDEYRHRYCGRPGPGMRSRRSRPPHPHSRLRRLPPRPPLVVAPTLATLLR
jgi:DNA-binding MurR/RpiR family transcriptional regulator